jgi:sugar O-acyltransferase (sialic acid O-acetyltransferase NeuD family)
LTKGIIWGSSGHGKVVLSLFNQLGIELIAICDNDPNAVSIDPNFEVIHSQSELVSWLAHYGEPKKDLVGAIAIGGPRGDARLEVLEMYEALEIGTPPLIHPAAVVEATSKVGNGTQILANAIVGVGSTIGRGCIVNHGAIVDHECDIGDGSHIAPGGTLCGLVRLGRNVFIGAGATVLPRLTFGDNAIVGAGSLVTKSVPPDVTIAGNPASTNYKKRKKKI